MKLYLDLLMGLNFAVDLLLLLGTNRLCGAGPGPGRCALGAAVGAVYAGACLLPGMGFLGNVFWRGCFLVLMGQLAFGFGLASARRTGIFLVLSLALGGTVRSLGAGSGPGILLSALVLTALCVLTLGGGASCRRLVPLSITGEGGTVRLTALVDTGNTLRDPITGESVLVVDREAACRLTGLEPEELESPLSALGRIPGLRLIPYRAVGQPGGLLLCRRFDRTELNGSRHSRLVAFAPGKIGTEYRALAGGRS